MYLQTPAGLDVAALPAVLQQPVMFHNTQCNAPQYIFLASCSATKFGLFMAGRHDTHSCWDDVNSRIPFLENKEAVAASGSMSKCPLCKTKPYAHTQCASSFYRNQSQLQVGLSKSKLFYCTVNHSDRQFWFRHIQSQASDLVSKRACQLENAQQQVLQAEGIHVLHQQNDCI